jgi:hypothetical protein
MVSILKTRNIGQEPAVERRDVVQLLAALDDTEFRSVVEEARGPSLVPLAELVIEGLAPNVQQLAQALGDKVVSDDIGRRCVTRDTARDLFAEKAAEAERAAQRRKAALAKRAEPNPVRERVRAIRESGRDGLYIEPPAWRL